MKVKENVQARKLLQAVPSFLGTMAAAAFSPLFLFFKNAGEAHFRDVAPTMLMFMAAGAVLYALTLLLTRNPSRAGIISVAFLVVFLNYANIEAAIQSLLPSLRYWHIMPLLLVVLLHLGWLVWKKLPLELASIIMPVAAAVFGVLILLNGVMAIPAMTTRIRAEQEAKRLAEETVVAETTMPNFYFLLFDEYSSVPFMQKYFDYDNSEMLTQLEALGFNISQSGHNATYATAAITANLFQLDYIAEYEDPEEYTFSLRSDNKVFPLLREAGYEILSPANAAAYGLESALGTSSEAKTIDGTTLSSLIANQTVLYPYMIHTDSYPQEAQTVLEQLDYVKNMENRTDGGQFILAHFNLPHVRFLFEADGSVVENMDNVFNWKEPEHYLNQYIFTTNQILEIAQEIVENDPNAVVWILSDHSARAANDPDLFLKKFPPEDMTNFFSAVYYQGEELDIEGLSGVNTFRLILNELLGTEFEMIPLPAE